MEDLIKREAALKALEDLREQVSSQRKVPMIRREAVMTNLTAGMDLIRGLPAASAVKVPVSSADWTDDKLSEDGEILTDPDAEEAGPVPEIVPTVKDSYLVPIMAGSAIAKEKLYCHECMKPVGKEDAFCRYCGRPFSGEVVKHKNQYWDTVEEKPVEYAEII